MCLAETVRERNKLKELKKRNDPEKEYTFYKCFNIFNNQKNFYSVILQSPYQYRFRIYGPNIYTDRKTLEIYYSINTRKKIYDIGVFHARITSKATYDFFYGHKNKIIIPIKVKLKDIVAFGNNRDVCFKSFRVTKNCWNKVLKLIKDRKNYK